MRMKTRNVSKHLCPLWCIFQVYLLCRSKTFMKQVTKGLKYIKWTTYWSQKSSLTLTFEHVISKSIGIIYLLGVTPAPSLLLINWKGSKDIDRTTLGLQTDRPTDRPTYRPTVAKQYAPFFKGGIKIRGIWI